MSLNLGNLPTAKLLELRGILAKYSEDQPRDESGRFASSGDYGFGSNDSRLGRTFLGQAVHHASTAQVAALRDAVHQNMSFAIAHWSASSPQTTKAARTITISSGGKARDDALNPIVARVRAQLIALVAEHSNRPALKYSDDQERDDHGRWTSGGGDQAPNQGEGFDAWRQRLWDGLKGDGSFNGPHIEPTGNLYRAVSDTEHQAAQRDGAYKPLLGADLYVTNDPDRLAGGAYGGKGGGHIIEIDGDVPTHQTTSRTVAFAETAATTIPLSAVSRVWSWDASAGDHVLSYERPAGKITKVSGLAFADAARAILRQGYAAAYLAGKKLPARAATVPPAATPPDEYDRYAEGYDWYGDLDDDGEDAVDDSSGGLNDRLLGLGALLLGGAVSAAMLDAWMGTYANSLNPLFEEGFQAGVNGVGEVQQATWVTEDDEACELCDPRNGMTWVGDEIDAAMPHPGEGGFGGPICMGSWRCRCSIDYEVVPADQATYSMGGYDQPEDDVEAMSTADLLKVWAITAKYELTDMPTSHLLTLRGILAKYSPDQERDDHGRWTSGGGGIDTPAETSGNIFLDPWHGQEGDAAATEREGSRDLKVGDKVVSSDGRVGTISHLGGPHGDDPAVLSVRYGQDYETTVLSDIHLADTWETPKGWMAGGVINSDPVPPSLTAGPLMAREVMTKSDDSGRNYQIMYPPGMNPNDPQVVRLRSELTDSVKYNAAMEQDTGIKNAWSGRLILGTGSQDGQESVAAVKAWSCDIRLASGWQANIIAGTYHSSEAANNNDEQLTLTHELAHGISNTVNGPDEKDDYMVSPGWEEGVAEGYARAFTDAQVLGPDTHTSFFQQGSYQNWVDGLDTARATVAMYTNTTGFMNPTASDRLDFYRTLLTTPLNGRSSMVSTMLEPTGHAGIALVGTPLGSNAWAFVENLHPFGIGKTATPDKVPTPEESRALMPKVSAHLAEHPEDWNTVGREAEMLWLIATALDKSAKPASKP